MPNRYVNQAEVMFTDPLEQWRWALLERQKSQDPALANAEHYLWNRMYAQEGPLEAAGALITPFGYYAAKNLGLTSGRSPATLDQLRMGLLGGLHGIGEGVSGLFGGQ